MKTIKELIKKDLEEDFTPKFQDLGKNLGIAPAGGGGSNKPPKPPAGLMEPKDPSKPAAKKTSVSKPKSMRPAAPKAPTAPKAPKAPTASGAKAVGKPSMPHGEGMNKKDLKECEEKKKKEPARKNEEVFLQVMDGFKPKFLDFKEIIKKEPKTALTCLPFDSLSKMDTKHAIVGAHVPNKVAPPPKPKKMPKSDEGSGGKPEVAKEEIPHNTVIHPVDRVEALRKLRAKAKRLT